MLIKPDTQNIGAKIIICGVGGAGCNAVNSMIESGQITGVHFMAVNTDSQVLEKSLAETVLPIGKDLTKGLGAGGNPVVGKQAAEDSVDYLSEALAGTDMVFVTGGMGGGTGTGASPVIAGIAKQLGALTVGVVTKPFHFELNHKMNIALKGIEDLKSKVDALIVIPNQRILEIIDRNVSFLQAMKKSDEVLLYAIKSISDIITVTGQINVDFADVKAIMHDAGTALMGMGSSTNKESRAIDAAKAAIHSPLLDYSIDGAKGVLISIRGSSSLSMIEVSEAVEVIRQYVAEDALIKYGVIIDDTIKDEVIVTVIATGFAVDPLEAEIRTGSVSSQRLTQSYREAAPEPRPTPPAVEQNINHQSNSAPRTMPFPSQSSQQYSSHSQSSQSQHSQSHSQPQPQPSSNNDDQGGQQAANPQPRPNPQPQKQNDDDDHDLEIPAFMRRRQNI